MQTEIRKTTTSLRRQVLLSRIDSSTEKASTLVTTAAAFRIQTSRMMKEMSAVISREGIPSSSNSVRSTMAVINSGGTKKHKFKATATHSQTRLPFTVTSKTS